MPPKCFENFVHVISLKFMLHCCFKGTPYMTYNLPY